MLLKLLRTLAISTLLLGAAGTATGVMAQDTDTATSASDDTAMQGDIERGKKIYQTKNCRNCHGWDGAGLGRDPRAPGPAANLRETQLDPESMREIVRCGIPGTPMPYHDSQAYKDDRCFGMTFDDFDDMTRPVKGKTFREKDIINVVAYVQATLKGKGETTLADCEAYFGEGEKACDFLR